MSSTFPKASAYILGILLALSFETTAVGAQITPGSNIDITGSVDPIGGSSVGTATGLDFLTSGAPSPGTPGTITLNSDPTGSFSSIFTLAGCPLAASQGGCGTIQDLLSFSPTLPISPFYTVTEGANTLSFVLKTLNTPVQDPGSAGSLPTLSVSGTGTFLLPGFDPTPGIFTLTSQGVGETSFSASTIATSASIPEPASLTVLALGLVGLGMALRTRRA
jgi:hypothetical protein